MNKFRQVNNTVKKMVKKIGIISQARMTSSRLPGKPLMEINGKSLLEYHLDRLKKTGFDIYLATSVNKQDDPVVDLCLKMGVNYYRGSELDVLSRYYECAKKYQLDTIVRVTADCPLIDENLIKRGILEYQNDPSEIKYASNCIIRTFSRGFDFEIFSYKSLSLAHKNSIDKMEREHVTPYIRNKIKEIKFINILNTQDNSNLRLTVDEIDDFNLISILIKDHAAHNYSASELEKLLLLNPDLIKINAHIEQKK
jgi:spore coat polysaccharide biosynthesis protein SpsF